MHNQLSRLIVSGVAMLAVVLAPMVNADDDPDSRSSASDIGLDQVREVIANGDYVTAINKLDALRKKKPDDADVLNLLGYSYRKQGKFDQAQIYYQSALKVQPGHRGANEYLGELYLETGHLQKAEERLAILDKECFFTCEEFSHLKKSIYGYKVKHGLDWTSLTIRSNVVAVNASYKPNNLVSYTS